MRAGCFYSTLVRLKAGTCPHEEASLSQFLFHIGAIKSFMTMFLTMGPVLFLFHIGAIKSMDSTAFASGSRACFYSTLVRLKERERHRFNETMTRFYSTLVRLKVKTIYLQ